jgi:hypothetical protein
MDAKTIVTAISGAILITAIAVTTLKVKDGEEIVTFDYQLETSVVVPKSDGTGTYIHAYVTDDELKALKGVVYYSCLTAPKWATNKYGRPQHVFDTDCNSDSMRHNIIIDLNAKSLEKASNGLTAVVIESKDKDKVEKDPKIKLVKE